MACGLGPGTARAQLAFSRPGELATIPEDRQKRLEEAMDGARYRLGPIRVDPWLGVKDLGYSRDINGQRELTATAGAGLRAYLPVRSRLIVGAYALPQYVWWQNAGRRRLDGRYGAGAFGFWNRLRVEAEAARDEVQDLASPEIDVRVHQRSDRVRLAAGIGLSGHLALEGSAQESRTETLDAGLLADLLRNADRREVSALVGLRLKMRGRIEMAIQAERSRVEALRCDEDCSSSGTATRLDIGYSGPSIALRATPSLQSFSWRGTDAHRTTGRATLAVTPRGRLSGSIYAGRSFYLGIDSDRPLILQDRAGVALGARMGWHTTGQLFVERGRDTRLGASDESTPVRSAGIDVGAPLRGPLRLSLRASRVDYASALGPYARGGWDVRVGLAVGGPDLPW